SPMWRELYARPKVFYHKFSQDENSGPHLVLLFLDVLFDSLSGPQLRDLPSGFKSQEKDLFFFSGVALAVRIQF
ncbi:hypothetical protein Bpfe_030490, partial [Biomphalaria pfeifferi]